MTFVHETKKKKKKSYAELSALKEFDTVNFLQKKNMDSNIYALLQRKVNKIKNTELPYNNLWLWLSSIPLEFKNIKWNTDANISSFIFFNANTTKGYKYLHSVTSSLVY